MEDSTVDNEVPENYKAYINDFNAAMEGVRKNASGGASSPEDIAATIYRAATDGTDQLRYVSGNDIQPIINLRTSTSEEKYIGFMRNLFDTKNSYSAKILKTNTVILK